MMPASSKLKALESSAKSGFHQWETMPFGGSLLHKESVSE
jgi:hypothetical protein